jgi:hypothetical protein
LMLLSTDPHSILVVTIQQESLESSIAAIHAIQTGMTFVRIQR